MNRRGTNTTHSVIHVATCLVCILLVAVLFGCSLISHKATLYICNESGYELHIYANNAYLGKVLYPNFNVFSLYIGSRAKNMTLTAMTSDQVIVVEVTRLIEPTEPYHWCIYGVGSSNFF